MPIGPHSVAMLCATSAVPRIVRPVFADPPYALPELAELPDRVMSSALVHDHTLFVLEHGKNYDFSDRPDFLEHRAYGSVNFSFFRRPTKGEGEEEQTAVE